MHTLLKGATAASDLRIRSWKETLPSALSMKNRLSRTQRAMSRSETTDVCTHTRARKYADSQPPASAGGAQAGRTSLP
jgi:hypothetical protein